MPNHQLVKQFQIDTDAVNKATFNLENKLCYFIAVSGKIGSGKDTVAPKIIEALGIEKVNSVQEYFAKPLKKEISTVVDLIRSSNTQNEAVEKTILSMSIKREKAIDTVSYIYQAAKNDALLNAYSRTPEMRKALQYWGTEVRREQDENYWVKKALKSVYELLSEGKSVYITDARFPNEIINSSCAHAKTIRLDVSYEEQERRIQGRDGIKVSEEARNHPSETSLDNYNEFDVRVLTDNRTPDEVVQYILSKIS